MTRAPRPEKAWRFSGAFDASSVPELIAARVGEKHEIVCANAALERLAGYETGALQGQVIARLFELEACARIVLAMESRTPQTRGAKLRLRHRDGSSFLLKAAIDPIPSPEGESAHFLISLLDLLEGGAIMGSVDILRVLRAKREWESAIDATADLVLLVDPSGSIQRANRTFERWKLGRVESAVGRSFHDAVHPGCEAEACYLEELVGNVFAEPAVEETLEVEADDELLERAIVATARRARVNVEADVHDYAVVTLADVTRARESDELRRRKERFEAMRLLIAGIAHEVGNPLAAMRTTLDVWQRRFFEIDDDAHRRYLARLSQGIARAQATLDQIRGGSNRRALESAQIGVGSLLTRTRELLEDQAGERGVGMRVELSAAKDLALLADVTAVDEVLANIVKNAVEACSSGDEVVLSAYRDGDQVVVVVGDTGSGISEEDMHRLFVPFFTSKPSGTGVGLAHVDRLMDRMGGRVEIESSYGEGTTVRLRFRSPPRSPAP